MLLYVVILPFLKNCSKNTSCKRKSNLLTLKLSLRHNDLIILRKENKMTENVIQMSTSIEDFMSDFGVISFISFIGSIKYIDKYSDSYNILSISFKERINDV